MSLSSGYFKKGMTMRAVWTLFLTAVLWISAPLQAAENVTYYHNDALGSPVAATDADGNLLWREIYEPFGRRFEQDPSSDGNSRWYTGHQETDYGLVYMGARHYDPVIGRFLSVDPVRFYEGNPPSFGRYSYANNNPYAFVDPDGRDIRAVGGLIAGCLAYTPCRVVAVKAAKEGSRYIYNRYYKPRTVADPPTTDDIPFYQNEDVSGESESNSRGRAGSHEPARAPDSLPAFPEAEKAKPKTPLQGGAGKRPRWKDRKGKIYEWDSRHGTVEKYDKTGKNHLGEYNPNTGDQVGPRVKGRRVEP